MGVVATLVSAFVANRVGRLQIVWMKRGYELNAKLAIPKVWAEVRIERRTPNSSRPDVIRYFLITTFHNDGDLAAKKVEGNWNLTCSENLQDRSIPISWDFLGKGSRELESQELGGDRLTNLLNGGNNIWINVDIECSYFGEEEKTPHPYTTSYEYDRRLKQMVKQS